MLLTTRFLFVCLIFSITSSFSYSEETVWLRGTFKEVNSASPVVGEATFPLNLTRAVIAATPKKFLDEAMEGGFNISAIFQAVEAMPVGETFELNNDEYILHIEKFAVNEPEPAESKLLLIHLEETEGTTNIPVPLALTSTAIPLLQLALKELKGMEEPLSIMLDEVKKTKPGVLLIGEDKLMKSKLEIKLQ